MGGEEESTCSTMNPILLPISNLGLPRGKPRCTCSGDDNIKSPGAVNGYNACLMGKRVAFGRVWAAACRVAAEICVGTNHRMSAGFAPEVSGEQLFLDNQLSAGGLEYFTNKTLNRNINRNFVGRVPISRILTAELPDWMTSQTDRFAPEPQTSIPSTNTSTPMFTEVSSPGRYMASKPLITPPPPGAL